MPPLFVEGPARLQIVSFGPNRIDFTVSAEATSRVYLNTNWSSGWSTNVGTIITSENAAYVTIDPTRQGEFAFWFVPSGLWAGVVVMLASIAAAIKMWPLTSPRFPTLLRAGAARRRRATAQEAQF